MKSWVAMLLWLCGLFGVSVAQENASVMPKAGEIALEGTITTIEAGRLQIMAQSFTLTSGKITALQPPKPKSVVTVEKTLIQVRGDASRRVRWGELKPGMPVRVTGSDKGSGADLPARVIEVWKNLENGVYQWDAKPATPAGNAPPREAPGDLPNLLPQGDFESAENAAPTGWKVSGALPPRLEKQGDNHWLTFAADAPQARTEIVASIPVKPDWKTIRYSAQVKVERLQRGKLWINTPRLNWRVFDAQGQQIQDGRGLNLFEDCDWQRVGQTMLMPAGAARFDIVASMQGATGRFSLDSVRLEANAPVELLPLRPDFPEGKFSEANPAGVPDGFISWTDFDMSVAKEDGNSFLRFVNKQPNRTMGASSHFELPRGWAGFKFRARMRTKNLIPGAKSWEHAKIGLVPENEFGERLGPNLQELFLREDSDWIAKEVTNILPPGTVALRIEPCLLNATGIFDLDDLQIEEAADLELPNTPIRAEMTEGALETLNDKGWPVGWKAEAGPKARFQVAEENGNHFLRLTSAGEEGYISVSSRFKLPAEWKALVVKGRLRAQNLQRKDTNVDWKTARVKIIFQNANGEQVGGWPPSLQLDGDSDWKTLAVKIDVPRQARYVFLEPLMQETQGIFDVDDIEFQEAAPENVVAPILEWTRAFPEGSFEAKDENGAPLGWQLLGANTEIAQQDGNHFLRLSSTSTKNTALAIGQWKVSPRWKTVRVRARLRLDKLQAGVNAFDGAHLQVVFLNNKEERLMPLPPPIELKKNSDWTDLQMQCEVPPGAAVIQLLPALSRSAGTFDVDDVLIEPIDNP